MMAWMSPYNNTPSPRHSTRDFSSQAQYGSSSTAEEEGRHVNRADTHTNTYAGSLSAYATKPNTAGNGSRTSPTGCNYRPGITLAEELQQEAHGRTQASSRQAASPYLRHPRAGLSSQAATASSYGRPSTVAQVDDDDEQHTRQLSHMPTSQRVSPPGRTNRIFQAYGIRAGSPASPHHAYMSQSHFMDRTTSSGRQAQVQVLQIHHESEGSPRMAHANPPSDLVRPRSSFGSRPSSAQVQQQRQSSVSQQVQGRPELMLSINSYDDIPVVDDGEEEMYGGITLDTYMSQMVTTPASRSAVSGLGHVSREFLAEPASPPQHQAESAPVGPMPVTHSPASASAFTQRPASAQAAAALTSSLLQSTSNPVNTQSVTRLNNNNSLSDYSTTPTNIHPAAAAFPADSASPTKIHAMHGATAAAHLQVASALVPSPLGRSASNLQILAESPFVMQMEEGSPSTKISRRPGSMEFGEASPTASAKQKRLASLMASPNALDLRPATADPSSNSPQPSHHTEHDSGSLIKVTDLGGLSASLFTSGSLDGQCPSPSESRRNSQVLVPERSSAGSLNGSSGGSVGSIPSPGFVRLSNQQILGGDNCMSGISVDGSSPLSRSGSGTGLVTMRTPAYANWTTDSPTTSPMAFTSSAPPAPPSIRVTQNAAPPSSSSPTWASSTAKKSVCGSPTKAGMHGSPLAISSRAAALAGAVGGQETEVPVESDVHHALAALGQSEMLLRPPTRQVQSARPVAARGERELDPSVWEALISVQLQRPPSRQKPPPEALHLWSPGQVFGDAAARSRPTGRPQTAAAATSYSRQANTTIRPTAGMQSDAWGPGQRPPSRQKPPPMSLILEHPTSRPQSSCRAKASSMLSKVQEEVEVDGEHEGFAVEEGIDISSMAEQEAADASMAWTRPAGGLMDGLMSDGDDSDEFDYDYGY